MPQIDFAGLDATGFEEFCFELLRDLPGFFNVDWRKGTALAASPSDRGRDIVADVDRTDVDGARFTERWFFDCKHHKRGVPPEALQGLLTWAQAERPHVVVVITSGFVSNPSKDFLRDYERNSRPPFRVKTSERPPSWSGLRVSVRSCWRASSSRVSVRRRRSLPPRSSSSTACGTSGI